MTRPALRLLILVAALAGCLRAPDDAQIRSHYLQLVATIGPMNEQGLRDHRSAEERARRAFAIRHDARLACRAMMKVPAEVEALRRRDQAKYGHPDGPTFDDLVEHQRHKGLTGDAVFEAIIQSAQRTDQAVNDLFGLKGGP